MEQTEIILFWMTVFVYVGAFCVHIFGFVRGSTRTDTVVIRLLWVGIVLHTAVALIRWSAAGHAPVTDNYELNLTGTWFTLFVFLVFERLKKVDRSIALVVTPVVFLVMGHGLMTRSAPIPMGPAFQSPWLVVHVIFAWLSFGCFAIAFGAAVLFLVRERFPDWQPITKVPDLMELDLAGYRFIVLGFINHSVMLVSGAIWAKKLWGHYWSWDVLEIWSLITFLFYAFYLHARSFLGWRMKRAAWLTGFGFVVLAISFWGVQWFSPIVRQGHEWNERGGSVAAKEEIPKTMIEK